MTSVKAMNAGTECTDNLILSPSKKCDSRLISHRPRQVGSTSNPLNFYLRRSHAGQWMVKCQLEEQGWFTFLEYFVKLS